MYKLKKRGLKNFLVDLGRDSKVYAPVKKDIVRFELFDSSKEVNFKENSYFPIKEHFFRKVEVLFKFSNNKIIPVDVKSEKKIFFGVRRCDLNSIMHQDMIFKDDVYYNALRKNVVLIGYHCNKAPSKFCFCESMGLVDFYDIMLFDKGNYFLVDVKGKKGKEIIKKYKNYFERSKYKLKSKDKYIKTRKLKKLDIRDLYDNKNWNKGVKDCLSCGACTEMCPSCYCHEFCDKVCLSNVKKGERIRKWSSCQLKEFTRVAGDHYFRESKEARFKHRIYHQLVYFKDRYGVVMCTGCGRCILGCPTRIDWVRIINEM